MEGHTSQNIWAAHIGLDGGKKDPKLVVKRRSLGVDSGKRWGGRVNMFRTHCTKFLKTYKQNQTKPKLADSSLGPTR